MVRRLDRRQRRSFASPRAAADFVFSRRRRRVRRREPSRRGEGSRGGHPRANTARPRANTARPERPGVRNLVRPPVRRLRFRVFRVLFVVVVLGEDGAPLHLEAEDEADVVPRGSSHDGVREVVHLVVVPPRLELVLVRLLVLFLPHLRVRAPGDVSLETLPGALLAPEAVVRVRARPRVEREEPPELLLAHGALLERPLAVDDVLEALLAELALEHLLLDGARGEEAVQVALFLLPVAPAPRRRLLVVGGVPVRVEQHKPVPADEVDPAPAGFRGEQEHELVLRRVVELLHELLALADARRAVQADRGVVVLAAQELHEVQRLRVVADDDDAVLGLRA